MNDTIRNLPVSLIIPGDNDRTVFDPEALRELAASIEAHGLAQPITVRPLSDCYQIVAGERRFRACRDLLHWETVPALIRDLSDEDASAIMLAENVARADLDPLDEALAYQRRIDAFGWSVKDVADKAGVSTVRVRFRLKLLDLRPEVQALVRNEQLALGYAQILADAKLDTNRQLLAIARLRDNPSPTPPWFRREVSRLLEQQSQESLFNTDAFWVAPPEDKAPAFVEPPHPSTTTPPTTGQTLTEIVKAQIAFWTQAAEDWDELGKPFKRQECQAAAQALNLALAAA